MFMDLFTPKISKIELMKVEALLKQLNDTVNTINHTTNPDIFFGRLNFAIDALLELQKYEKYRIFKKRTPTEDLNELLNGLENNVNIFINRSYQNEIDKNKAFKKESTRIQHMRDYAYNMFYAFENANTYWLGNNTYPHYSERLYTDNNINLLHSLLDKYIVQSNSLSLNNNCSNSICNTNDKNSLSVNINSFQEIDEWNIFISFGKSTSPNLDRAIYLAKQGNYYEETIFNNKPIYQAYFLSDANSYLKFIQLYEMVNRWRSCAIMINGEFINKDYVGSINYCYGNKCRSFVSNYCSNSFYGGKSPFGCKMISIKWWEKSTFNGFVYKIDKQRIKEEVYTQAVRYKYCPSFNMDKVEEFLDKLPNKLTRQQYEKLAYNLSLF